MNDLLREVKEALAKATPGPWEWLNETKTSIGAKEPLHWICTVELAFPNMQNNSGLIAQAPTWLQSLITALEEAQRENTELSKRVEQADSFVLKLLAKDKSRDELDGKMQEFEERYRHSDYDFIHLQSENDRLRTEHAAMKEALTVIVTCDIPYVPMTDHSVMKFYEETAHNCLSTLSQGGNHDDR